MAQGIPDERNVNIVGGAPTGGYPDVGLKQQNEAWCTKKPAFPLHSICILNDYRAVDDPSIGDAWMGWSWSINGGQTYQSDLLPAHLGDSPNLGFGFAADPSVIAVPGMAFGSFIASNRGESEDGGLFFLRFFEVNREAGRPWLPAMLPTEAIRGTPGQFVDKPVMLFHMAPPGSGTVTVSDTLKDGTAVSQEVPAGRIFLGYTIFLNNRNKLYVAWSDDFGESWRKSKLSETIATSQSAALAANGDDVCAVWRRFERNRQSNAIMVACSNDRGSRWPKASVLSEDPEFFPFDQATSETTFRVNSYPVIATDGSKFYAVWASRKPAPSPFYSRIVFSVSDDGGATWSTPEMIEDAPLGHQYHPTIAVARGTVQVGWMDTRNDLFQQVFIQDVLDESSGSPPTKVIRQLGDMRTAQITGGVPTASVQVSKYLHGVREGQSGPAEQLQFNFLNDRIFQIGSVPFNGDYPNIVGPLFRLEDGEWVSNAAPAADGRQDEFLVTFTDNRDVFGNVWENLSDPTVYTPANQSAAASAGDIESGLEGLDGEAQLASLEDGSGGIKGTRATPGARDQAQADAEPDPTDTYPACAADGLNRDRSRNQNVYSNTIRPGVSIENASADKPNGSVQRAHVVWISNNTSAEVAYTVTIDNQPPDAPVDGRASFLQVPVAPFVDGTGAPSDDGLLTSLDVDIDPNSTVARTVFVTSQIVDTPIGVSVSDGGGTVLGSITLNPDVRTPDIQNPDVQNPDVQNPDIQNAEVHNPDVQNPVITSVANPDVQNPDIQNPDVQNPDVQNPDVQNPDVQNPDIQNPDIQNETLEGSSSENPDTAFDDLTPAERANGYTDITWETKNIGNTTTAMNLDAFINGDTTGLRTQLIGTRTQITETARDCVQLRQVQNNVIFNHLDPDLGLFEENTTALIFGDGSAYVAPNERIFITLRVWGDPNFPEDRAGIRVEAQSCNSEDKGPGTEECDPPFDQINEPDAGPVINIPDSPVTLEAFDNDGFDGAFFSQFVTATDDVDPSVDLTCTAGEEEFMGTDSVLVQFDVAIDTQVQVDCTATDSVTNTTEVSFIVESTDTTPPEITFDDSDGTTDLEVFTTDTESVTVYYLGETDIDLGTLGPLHVTVSDAVDEDAELTLECTPASGSDFDSTSVPFGSVATTVTCTAEDYSGNQAEDTFDVIVTFEPIG